MSHRCSECNMHFGNAGALGSHQRVHKKVEVPCSICGAIFSSTQACATHMKVHLHVSCYPPIPQRRFICSECSCEFTTSDERFNHMADCHQIILREDI